MDELLEKKGKWHSIFDFSDLPLPLIPSSSPSRSFIYPTTPHYVTVHNSNLWRSSTLTTKNRLVVVFRAVRLESDTTVAYQKKRENRKDAETGHAAEHSRVEFVHRTRFRHAKNIFRQCRPALPHTTNFEVDRQHGGEIQRKKTRCISGMPSTVVPSLSKSVFPSVEGLKAVQIFPLIGSSQFFTS